MHHIPTDQYLPSGRGEFIVRGVAEALKFTSLAIATIKKKNSMCIGVHVHQYVCMHI